MSHAIPFFPVGRRFVIVLVSALSVACGGGASGGLGTTVPVITQGQAANSVPQQPIPQQPASVQPAPQQSMPAPLPQSSPSSSSTATTARFNNPTGIAAQANGILYVVDSGNQTIRKIVQGKTVVTIAGTPGAKGSADGTGAAAQFNNPTAITADATGNLYVADTGSHTIRKITPAGVVTTVAGTAGLPGSADGTGAAARFNRPAGIAADAAGNLYVTDELNYLIRKITPAGVVSTLSGTAGARGYPQSAIADSDIASATFINPLAIAVDPAGSLYISDGYFLPPEPNTIAGVAIIRKITPAGMVSALAGGFYPEGPRNTDGTGPAARFYNSAGIAINTADNLLYVVDTWNQSIRKVTQGGEVTTFVGAAARMSYPKGITIDSGGNLYVADTGNHTIRKVTPAGVVTTFAGAEGKPGSIDVP